MEYNYTSDKQITEIIRNMFLSGLGVSEIANELELDYKKVQNTLQSLHLVEIKTGYSKGSKPYETVKSYYPNVLNYYHYEFPGTVSCSRRYFRYIVLSNLNFRGTFADIECLRMIASYCVKRHIGDIIINGNIFSNDVDDRESAFELIDKFLRCYPRNRKVRTVMLMGKNDLELLNKYGIDLIAKIRRRRQDIIPIGYGYGVITIENSAIGVCHPLVDDQIFSKDYHIDYLLCEDTYASKLDDRGNITVETPCFNLDSSDNVRGALDVTNAIEYGKIVGLSILPIGVNSERVYIGNNFDYNLRELRNISKTKRQ